MWAETLHAFGRVFGFGGVNTNQANRFGGACNLGANRVTVDYFNHLDVGKNCSSRLRRTATSNQHRSDNETQVLGSVRHR